MNPFPILVAVLGWLCLGLEVGLKGRLSFEIGTRLAAPSFVVPLAVFIAVCATPTQTLWTCLGLGLMLDLLSRVDVGRGTETITVIGPHALGLLVAGQFVLLTRGLMIRRNPLTIVALSIPAALLMHIVIVAFFTIRQVYAPIATWSTTAELATRFVSSLLTGGSALAVSIVLMPMAPALGLQPVHGRRR
jgi:hypothetical protein